MEYNSGEFICPKCNEKGMKEFTNWQNRTIYTKSSFEKQWIFYKKTIKEKKKCERKYFTFKCLIKPFPFLSDCGNDWSFFLVSCICCPFALLYIILYFILGVLVFIWIEIFDYLCCKKDKYEYRCLNLNYSNNQFGETVLDEYEDKNIWNTFEGVLEHIILEKGKNLFFCNKCKWNEDTFFNFTGKVLIKGESEVTIKNDKDNNNDNSKCHIEINPRINLTTDKTDITVIFAPSSNNYHNAIICNLNETFECIENKLYQKFPYLKNKNLDFVYHGNILTEKWKTLFELKIKDSDIVFFYEKNTKFFYNE
jgi:hypothetical protein